MIEIPYPQSSTKADSGRIRPGHQAARGMPHVHIVGNLATRRLAHTKESPQSAPNGRTPCHATADGGGGCTVAAGTDGRTARKPHPPFPACFQVTHHEKYWKTKDFAKKYHYMLHCSEASTTNNECTRSPLSRIPRESSRCRQMLASPVNLPTACHLEAGVDAFALFTCGQGVPPCMVSDVWFRIRRETIHGIRAQGRAVSAYPRFIS